jgi:hypothetical protein
LRLRGRGFHDYQVARHRRDRRNPWNRRIESDHWNEEEERRKHRQWPGDDAGNDGVTIAQQVTKDG